LVTEPQKEPEDPVVESQADEEEDLPSLGETGEELKDLGHETVDRAKEVGVNGVLMPVREAATNVVDAVADGLDALFGVFERKYKRRRRSKK
jgi:hypothetical protein